MQNELAQLNEKHMRALEAMEARQAELSESERQLAELQQASAAGQLISSQQLAILQQTITQQEAALAAAQQKSTELDESLRVSQGALTEKTGKLTKTQANLNQERANRAVANQAFAKHKANIEQQQANRNAANSVAAERKAAQNVQIRKLSNSIKNMTKAYDITGVHYNTNNNTPYTNHIAGLQKLQQQVIAEISNRKEQFKIHVPYSNLKQEINRATNLQTISEIQNKSNKRIKDAKLIAWKKIDEIGDGLSAEILKSYKQKIEKLSYSNNIPESIQSILDEVATYANEQADILKTYITNLRTKYKLTNEFDISGLTTVGQLQPYAKLLDEYDANYKGYQNRIQSEFQNTNANILLAKLGMKGRLDLKSIENNITNQKKIMNKRTEVRNYLRNAKISNKNRSNIEEKMSYAGTVEFLNAIEQDINKAVRSKLNANAELKRIENNRIERNRLQREENAKLSSVEGLQKEIFKIQLRMGIKKNNDNVINTWKNTRDLPADVPTLRDILDKIKIWEKIVDIRVRLGTKKEELLRTNTWKDTAIGSLQIELRNYEMKLQQRIEDINKVWREIVANAVTEKNKAICLHLIVRKESLKRFLLEIMVNLLT